MGDTVGLDPRCPNGHRMERIDADFKANTKTYRPCGCERPLFTAEGETTEAGRMRGLVEYALFLRMYGDNPPGHQGENWRDWDVKAEQELRAAGGEVGHADQ